MIRYSVLTVLYYLCDLVHLLISIVEYYRTSFVVNILLANFKDGLFKLCEEMPPTPKAWEYNTSIGLGATSYGLPLVVCCLGNEYSRTLPHVFKTKEISISDTQLFHKMGRRQTVNKHHNPNRPKILLEEYHYAFQNSEYVGHK